MQANKADKTYEKKSSARKKDSSPESSLIEAKAKTIRNRAIAAA
jgi:hypothetical protein